MASDPIQDSLHNVHFDCNNRRLAAKPSSLIIIAYFAMLHRASGFSLERLLFRQESELCNESY
jgi:hypothetical protein